MRITEAKLKKIIKEEIAQLLTEQSSAETVDMMIFTAQRAGWSDCQWCTDYDGERFPNNPGRHNLVLTRRNFLFPECGRKGKLAGSKMCREAFNKLKEITQRDMYNHWKESYDIKDDDTGLRARKCGKIAEEIGTAAKDIQAINLAIDSVQNSGASPENIKKSMEYLNRELKTAQSIFRGDFYNLDDAKECSENFPTDDETTPWWQNEALQGFLRLVLKSRALFKDSRRTEHRYAAHMRKLKKWYGIGMPPVKPEVKPKIKITSKKSKIPTKKNPCEARVTAEMWKDIMNPTKLMGLKFQPRARWDEGRQDYVYPPLNWYYATYCNSDKKTVKKGIHEFQPFDSEIQYEWELYKGPIEKMRTYLSKK